MNTREKLIEALEILDAMLSNPRCHKAALRVRDLVQSARDDFFSDANDTAALGQCFLDDDILELDLDVDQPFPAA